MRHIEMLKSLNAYDDTVEWAQTQPDLETAWNNCQHPDWMLWLADKMLLFTDKDLRLMACQFVRRTPMGDGTVWDALDEAHRNCVIVAERYANGEATREELASARDTAWDSARDTARDFQCDIIREYGNPFNGNKIKGATK